MPDEKGSFNLVDAAADLVGSEKEVDKLLAASKTSSRNPVRDYCILLLMFRHGLRVSELCSMKLTDINLDIKEFHVTQKFSYA